MLSTSTVGTLITDTTNTFKDIAGNNLGIVIAVAALLIGAGFVWSRFKKHVAGKKI